jgi:hypothetical protein
VLCQSFGGQYNQSWTYFARADRGNVVGHWCLAESDSHFRAWKISSKAADTIVSSCRHRPQTHIRSIPIRTVLIDCKIGKRERRAVQSISPLQPTSDRPLLLSIAGSVQCLRETGHEQKVIPHSLALLTNHSTPIHITTPNNVLCSRNPRLQCLSIVHRCLPVSFSWRFGRH